jgi:beta-lactam-binding protein with PASTA domain
MKLIAFLTSKTFFANVILAAISLVALWFITIWGLRHYTRFGEEIVVPDLRTYSLDEVDHALGQRNLTWMVLDSSEYIPALPPGSVVNQYPEAGSTVKRLREIKLTLNPFAPPKIQLPDLVGKTRRRAIYNLESKGFVVGKLIYKPYLARDEVLDADVRGIPILPGEFFEKGTVVNLTLGSGLNDERVGVPFLVGLSLADATSKLSDYGLNIGAVLYDDGVDTAEARVYRQYPKPTMEDVARQGSPVDLWLGIYEGIPENDSLSFYQYDGLPPSDQD